MEYNIDSKKWTSFAGSGTSGSEDGKFKDAQFSYPSRITCDEKGDLLVVDQWEIKKLSFKSQSVETISPTAAYCLCVPCWGQKYPKLNAIVKSVLEGTALGVGCCL